MHETVEKKTNVRIMELAVQTCVMIDCLAGDICVETIIVCLSALIVHLSECVETTG